jgi:hypothetical protein
MLEPARRDAASAGNSMMVLMSGSLWLPRGRLPATGVIKNRTWLTVS